MHPLLASKKRLFIYLLSWAPVVNLLSHALTAAANIAYLDAVLVTAPACVLFALICLSPYYLGRVLPARLADLPRIVGIHLTAGVVSSLLLVGVIELLLVVILRRAGVPYDSRFAARFPLVIGVGMLLYSLSVALHYAVLAIAQARDAEQRELAARVGAREAELRALKAQVNPHFLFNSLNSISALTSIDAARAREMCVRLSDFLRSGLGLGDREMIPFADELALARSYLAIEEMRFGARLRVEQQVGEDCARCQVPSLILQPLVENAVKHGVSSLAEDAWIRISASRALRSLEIVIENAYDEESRRRNRGGRGLAIVNKRLLARYGDAASVNVHGAGGLFRVELHLPCNAAADAAPAERSAASSAHQGFEPGESGAADL